MKSFMMTLCVIVAILSGSVSNSFGDAKAKSGLLMSRVNCAQTNCNEAYLKFIDEKNPRLNKKVAKQIVSAVKYFAPRYFGEGASLEVGTEMTLSIMGVESNFKPDALGDVDHKDGPAYSLMQILGPTAEKAKKYNGIKAKKDPMALWDNIHLGMAEINRLHEKFDGNWQATVTAYNRGWSAVDYIMKNNNLANYDGYWIKVERNKQRINYIKEEIYVQNLSAKY